MCQRHPRFGFVLVALVGLLLTGACSSPTTLPSQSTTQPMSVDAKLGEWNGRLTYLDDEPVSMSVAPTDSLLYVALAIQDRDLIRSVAKKGLIVWVDPSGKQQRTYGIQHPLGLQTQRTDEGGSGSRSSDGASDGGAGPSGASRQPGTESMLEQVSLEELAILRQGTPQLRVPARFSTGLRAKVRLDPGSMIYELAIPVAEDTTANRQHALRASLGRTVGIGLETPESETEEQSLDNPNQGVPSVTGRGGGTRRGRGGRPGRRRGQQQQNREDLRPDLPELDLWAQVVSKEGG